VSQPVLTKVKRENGRWFWTARWYDDDGRRRRKNFGRVEDVSASEASVLFGRWLLAGEPEPDPESKSEISDHGEELVPESDQRVAQGNARKGRVHPDIFNAVEAAEYLGLETTRTLVTLRESWGLTGSRVGKSYTYHRSALDRCAFAMFGIQFDRAPKHTSRGSKLS
jgi:hypothetical protein